MTFRRRRCSCRISKWTRRSERRTTLMSINNASATAVIAHVVLWTDLSVHVLDFDVYLTGYDVQSINLRDILVNGNLPVTACDGQDPTDTISPQGPASQDINFASCNGILPYDNPSLTRPTRSRAEHADRSGVGRPLRRPCAGVDHEDRIARGYVTVDTVNNCYTFFPQDVATSSTVDRHGDVPERPLGRLLLRQPGAELRAGRDPGAHRSRYGSTSASTSTPSTIATLWVATTVKASATCSRFVT